MSRAEEITSEVRKLVLTCRSLEAQLQQSVPKKTHQEIISKMQNAIDNLNDDLSRTKGDLEKTVTLGERINTLESSVASQNEMISSQNRVIGSLITKLSEALVPAQTYAEATSRIHELEERIGSMVDGGEYNSLQAQCKELETKMSEMVPSSQYADLERQLANSVPKERFAALEDQLANSVARSSYEELERALLQTVPKEQYSLVESKLDVLQKSLANSVPRQDFEELASKIARLTAQAEEAVSSASATLSPTPEPSPAPVEEVQNSVSTAMPESIPTVSTEPEAITAPSPLATEQEAAIAPTALSIPEEVVVTQPSTEAPAEPDPTLQIETPAFAEQPSFTVSSETATVVEIATPPVSEVVTPAVSEPETPTTTEVVASAASEVVSPPVSETVTPTLIEVASPVSDVVTPSQVESAPAEVPHVESIVQEAAPVSEPVLEMTVQQSTLLEVIPTSEFNAPSTQNTETLVAPTETATHVEAAASHVAGPTPESLPAEETVVETVVSAPAVSEVAVVQQQEEQPSPLQEIQFSETPTQNVNVEQMTSAPTEEVVSQEPTPAASILPNTEPQNVEAVTENVIGAPPQEHQTQPEITEVQTQLAEINAAVETGSSTLNVTPSPLVVEFEKGFRFTNTEFCARSGLEFLEDLEKIDPATLEQHCRNGDFERWFNEVLLDESSTNAIKTIRESNVSGPELRTQLLAAVSHRYKT